MSASIYLVTKSLRVCLVYNTPRSDITGKEFHGPYVHDRYDHIVATIYQYTVFKKHAFVLCNLRYIYKSILYKCQVHFILYKFLYIKNGKLL